MFGQLRTKFWNNAATRGVVLMLLSTVIFSLTHVSIREASAHTPPIQVAFLRNVFAVIFIIPLMVRMGRSLWVTSSLKIHVLRASLHVTAMFAFFTAVSIAPLARVTALGYTAPIFAAVISVLILGEKFRLYRWSAIIMGFLGALIILRPGFDVIDTGSLLVLFASALWGVVLVLIKLLGKKDSSFTITAYMSVLGTLLSAIPAYYIWVTPLWHQWPILIFIGLISTVGQLCLTEALKHLDTTAAMPFDFLRLIWAAIFGFIFFSEIPDIYLWIGAIIIFGSGFMIAYRESVKNRSNSSTRQ